MTNKFVEERGSISPLLITLFSILLILIFIISNVASIYVSRRELTNRVESALTNSAQELDQIAYYYGAPLTDFLADISIREGSLRVPIDCVAARNAFDRNILLEKNGAEQIIIDSFTCDGYELSANVAELLDLPFQARVFNIRTFKIEVSASTSSFLLRNLE